MPSPMHHHRPVQLFEASLTITGRLPQADEAGKVRHLIIRDGGAITDDELAEVLPKCVNLETAVLSGVVGTTDRSVVALARAAGGLRGLDVGGCEQVTDVGVQELVRQALPLQWIRLSGAVGVTDPSVSAVVRSCARLVEMDVSEVRMLTAFSVRDVWTYSRKLRVLKLGGCGLLTDKAFPARNGVEEQEQEEKGKGKGKEKSLPLTPGTWLDEISPLILRHTAENLRVLDLGGCAKITDAAVEGIVEHARRIQTLVLSGCVLLTNRALEGICKLGSHLDVLGLAHAAKVTDEGVVQLARACVNLRSVDVSFCRRLTDMAVFELAGLQSLCRLGMVRVHKLTDNGVYFLAEHCTWLEQLHLSYCDRISLDAVHVVVQRLTNLQRLSVTGVCSFQRKGVERFSDASPSYYDANQQAVYRVYSGERIKQLARFLDKEKIRRRESEERNFPFIERSDDDRTLY